MSTSTGSLRLWRSSFGSEVQGIVASNNFSRRAQDFLDNTLAVADRTARQAAKLRVADEAVALIIGRNAERCDRIRVVLENLNETAANITRSVAFPPPMPLRTARDGGRH